MKGLKGTYCPNDFLSETPAEQVEAEVVDGEGYKSGNEGYSTALWPQQPDAENYAYKKYCWEQECPPCGTEC